MRLVFQNCFCLQSVCVSTPKAINYIHVIIMNLYNKLSKFTILWNVLSMGVALVTMWVMKETNLIRHGNAVQIVSFTEKRLYMSNKTECFSYEDGCCIHIKKKCWFGLLFKYLFHDPSLIYLVFFSFLCPVMDINTKQWQLIL